MRAELVYHLGTRTLRTVGGNLLLTNVSLDEAAEQFLGYVITCKS